MTDVYGTNSNDYLDNGTDGGMLVGRGGDDYYVINDLGDVAVENADEGHDVAVATVNFTLPDHVEDLYFDGDQNLDGRGNDLGNSMYGSGSLANFSLAGLGGDDQLFAYSGGDDTLDGGTGNDILQAAEGDDIYVFRDGDGTDEITDWQGEDKIQFDGSVLPESVLYGRDAEKLIITYGDNRIIVHDHFSQSETPDVGYFPIEGVTFADGTVHDFNYIATHLSAIPVPESPVLIGTDGDDYLDNGEGWGTMVGGEGHDTYIVNFEGDAIVENGVDDFDIVISSISYVLPDNVEDLYLEGGASGNVGTGNSLDNTIYGQHGSANSTLYGLAGNDWLHGPGGGDTTLVGGTGDDRLTGGFGNDTYLFSVGDGVDYIADDHDIDRIVFDSSVTPGEVFYSRVGIDLVISYANGGEITVATVFRPPFDPNDPNESRYEIETVEFADGTSHSWEYIQAHVADRTIDGGSGNDHIIAGGGNDTVIGGSGADLLEGRGGGDTISGGSGGDRVLGGRGDDTISGGSGNDTLAGEAGDDLITGDSGNDTILGGDGYDVMTGGAGNDVFVLELASAYNNVDAITDFNWHHDKIDMRDLLATYDPNTDLLSDYLISFEENGNTILAVDKDGYGSAESHGRVVMLEGVTGMPTVDTLVASGHIIVS